MAESSLKARIQEDMKAAMRSQDKPKLGVIRLILAALKQKEVDERIELSDADVLTILDKMCKQRRESIKQFTDGGRQDLVDNEQFEIDVITRYLPEPLSEAEVLILIKQAIAELQASSIKDMGKVMQAVKAKAEGRADMKFVGDKVKELL